MAKLGTYDPADVNIIVGTRKIDGLFNGTFITVARNNPVEIQAQIGARGEYALSANPDKSGTIAIVLHAEAESNIYLNSLVGSKSVIPVYIQRKGETINEIITAPEAWIQEAPQKEMDELEPSRTWLIGCGELQQIDAGV